MRCGAKCRDTAVWRQAYEDALVWSFEKKRNGVLIYNLGEVCEGVGEGVRA